ncbi:unnamed protein product [Periconia digitata]|uniref:Uncharacterized protein n=1 Tax=Periconia digitata TaxID=1303443 RepID=A0A9W4XYY0_9PLEO|nr:unnamed protein product [Periconia digitata]
MPTTTTDVGRQHTKKFKFVYMIIVLAIAIPLFLGLVLCCVWGPAKRRCLSLKNKIFKKTKPRRGKDRSQDVEKNGEDDDTEEEKNEDGDENQDVDQQSRKDDPKKKKKFYRAEYDAASWKRRKEMRAEMRSKKNEERRKRGLAEDVSMKDMVQSRPPPPEFNAAVQAGIEKREGGLKMLC